MKLFAKMVSGIGLLLTAGPSVVVFHGAMDPETARLLMVAGTACWFAGAPLWMNSAASVEKSRVHAPPAGSGKR